MGEHGLQRLLRCSSKRTLWSLALTLSALVLAGCGGPTGPAAVERLTLESCNVSSPGSSQQIGAHCGTLNVYENRAARTGRQIALNIVVLPSIGPERQPDPLFMFAGGPGAAATQSYLGLVGILGQVNRHRDIVLVDQRGTGKSNPLHCDLLPDMWDEPGAQMTEAAQGCLKSLDADPVYYTTENAVADFNDVRQALGYDQVNLYGASYGTRLALTYLRMFPQHVRTIILDGIVPQDYVLLSDVSAVGQRSLNLLLERCRSDAACSKAFPNVRAELDDLMKQLDQAPDGITIHMPLATGSTPYQLKRTAFAEMLRSMLFSRDWAASVPLLIHASHVQNSFEPFAGSIATIYDQTARGLSQGLLLSVMCTEEVPEYDRIDVVALNKDTYEGTAWQRSMEAYCSGWPKGDVSPWFKEPVTSDVPALLISGEADPGTPPAYGDQVARTLAKSLQVVISAGGHGNLQTGCMPELAALFLEAGSVADLDTSCARNIQPAAFRLNAP